METKDDPLSVQETCCGSVRPFSNFLEQLQDSANRKEINALTMSTDSDFVLNFGANYSKVLHGVLGCSTEVTIKTKKKIHLQVSSWRKYVN